VFGSAETFKKEVRPSCPRVLRLSYCAGHFNPQLYNLLDHGFIDSQTRALFVDSSSYNPALNIFAVVRILFEFTPSGKALKRALAEVSSPPRCSDANAQAPCCRPTA